MANDTPCTLDLVPLKNLTAMKKLFLFTTILMTVVVLFAQNRVIPSKEDLHRSAKTSIDQPSDDIRSNVDQVNNNYKSSMLAPNEHVIGATFFDSPTNKLLAHRIIRHEDGTIGVVWTMGEDFPSFPNRGTGYNYYNGSEWGPIPENRVEDFRAGWPSYASFGSNGEVFFSHDFATGEIYYHTRDDKGLGDWNVNLFSYLSGPDMVSHAKVITTGPDNNIIHLLANSYSDYLGQTMAMLYSRSQDGGLTWDIENVVLDGTGIDYYGGLIRDAFVLAEERAGTIAILAGYPWRDLFMLKSSDQGETWDKTVIWENPYPFFDWNVTITDTFFCMDNSASIALDSEGKAHVVFGINRVLHDSPGTQYWLFPYVDGIAYWNEDMETFSKDIHSLAPPDYGYTNSEMIQDYNYIGWMQDINGNGTIDLNDDIFYYRQHGASTMPTISIDEQDRIFVIFSSTTETYEYEFFNYKHLWARAYEHGFWGPFVDLTEDIAHIYDECIFPVLASSSDNNIHYIYHVDNIPGLGQLGDHDFVDTKIVYGSAPKTDLLTGIHDSDRPEEWCLKLNPNPTSGTFHLRYLIDDIGYLIAEVYAVNGVKVKTLMREYQVPGEHKQTFDISDLPNGIYFIRLQAGKQVETAKVILMK